MATGEAFKNEFQGMNQDLAKTKIPPNIYYEAINFRPSTDKGLSDGALENIRGLLALTTIPDTGTVQKISLDLTVPGTIFITISHNGIPITSATGFTITASSTPEHLYNFLINDTNFASALGSLYNVYYNSLYLLLNPLDLLPVVITPILGLTIDDNFIPAQSNLEVIGSTYINNDIYLLTTNNTTDSPGQGDPESIGQIWKLDIDNATNLASPLTLIYNNYLNFSTYNAIAPSAILGRYENRNIQRIYWTDFFNKLRTLNVVDPQVFALDVSLIDVQPSSDFSIPIMTEIGSAPGTAVIPIGCYQLAYRLTNVSGSATTYSLPSNMIFVTPNLSTNLGAEELQTAGLNWQYYRGDIKGTTTTKRIVWKIDNLDRDFSRIEAVILVRENKSEIPKITRIFEGPITEDSINITFDGDIYTSDDVLSISLEEYLTLANVFTKVKTITTKDNRLIVGNIDNSTNAELDFDARAYRFKTAGVFDIIDIKGTTTTTYGITVPADYDNVSETSDAIAPFNLETTDPLYSALGQFKADGITLGGEGKYISYEFVSVAIAADKTVEPITPQPLPIVSTNPDYTTSNLNLGVYSADKTGTDGLQEYPIVFPSAINDGMKYPQMNSIYWGYQNNEIYRIGIVFYDKSKNPYFTKWIGDIKMPDVFDTCPAANHQYEDGSLTGYTDYRKSFTTTVGTHGANEAYVCQLGLKINVNIPADLTDQIEGYSIVRVKREESDKKVISEGIISNTYIGGFTPSTTYFLTAGNMDYDTTNSLKDRISYITPSILDSSITIPSSGMKLRCSSILSPSNTLQNIDIVGGFVSVNKNKVLKMYNHTPVSYFEVDIDYAGLSGEDESIILNGETFVNLAFPSPGASALGNPSYTIKLNSVIPNTATGNQKFLVYLYNPILNQYGGDTYTNRANNEYIICSHFRTVKNKSTDYNDISLIFGGDVTNDIMDEQRIRVDWSDYPAGHNSLLFLYPSSSIVNRTLRHGSHPNISMDDLGPTLDETDYFYNKVYSCQNDIVRFFPKPDPFIASSEFVNRFYISEIKINGELTDAWSIFKTLNYWDVEGSYGAINGVSVLQDQVYFIQDKAFGRLLVNPKTAITSTTGEEIQLGRGNVIDSHEYVSVETGSTHQFSFLKSAYSLYFIDTRHNKIYQFSQGRPLTPESDLKGLHGWCINNIYGNLEIIDKPVYYDSTIGINGIHGVYDYVNNELIYTLSRGERGVAIGSERPDPIQASFTLVYNEKLKVFTAFYTHYPKNYITNNRVFISTDPTNLQELYLHNAGNYGEFYGTLKESSVTFTSNGKPEFTKIFNNLLIQSEVQDGNTLIDTDSGATPIHETFDSITVSNDHQNSGNIVLTAMDNIVRFFRSWRTLVPRHSQSAAYTSSGLYARMVDKYLRIKLSFQNNNNKRFILHNVISFFKVHTPR